MVKPVTIYIDDDKEIEGVRLKPLASKLAELAPGGPVEEGATSNATATATFNNGQTDVNADVTYDF